MVCKSCVIAQEQLYHDNDGACSQIICNHDEDDDINQSKSEFPTVEDMKQDGGIEKDAIPFRDLPVNEVYQVKDIKSINTKNGIGMILHLADQKDRLVRVWATSLVRKKYTGVRIDENIEKHFIMSEGRCIAKQSKKPYYKFTTHIKQTLK